MGTGESLLRLEYVSAIGRRREGRPVVTSGIDGIYPEGFVVGRVEEIERSGGLFRAIRVRPAVGLLGPRARARRAGPGGVRGRAADFLGRAAAAAGEAAMSALRMAGFIVIALVLQTTLARFLVRGSVGVDLVLVAVVYISLRVGPTAGHDRRARWPASRRTP